MLKLAPLLLLAATAFGCAGQTPAQQVATAEDSFTLAVTVLSTAKADNLISDADYHVIVGVEKAANAAFNQVETDIAAGTPLTSSEAWKAASAALGQVLIYKWKYNGSGSGNTTRPATNPVSYRFSPSNRNGFASRRGIASPIGEGGGGPPSRHGGGGSLG